ncbi:sigma-E factor regulator, RseC/MucC family [Gottschalkia purinilytica]|uniref:Sigma-E factor regulator, RseC/MucC family n=1 Tax=Gottschalkia purinilytica TaxID=1503 RepID=A0A0L0WB97_GOTPU|nr:SoxR reducing system RseC family protein [Gottschalkia purinilytica]KNF08707.1 sigma-E factor regulator, RseC/MucC family [Gottschalkia purinilytica]
MEQTGYVYKTDDKTAGIIVKRVSACGDSCASCSSDCSTSNITISIENTLDAKVGDYIKIRTRTKSVLKSIFIAYFIPLALMVIGVFLGVSLFKNLGFKEYESLGFLMGIIFLGISYVLLRIIDKKISKNSNKTFEMIEILRDKK